MPEGPTIIDSEWLKPDQQRVWLPFLDGAELMVSVDIRTGKGRVMHRLPHDWLARQAARAGFRLVAIDSPAASCKDTRVTS